MRLTAEYHRRSKSTMTTIASRTNQPLVSCDANALQKLVQSTFQSARLTVKRIDKLTDHLHQISVIHLSNGSQLILKLNPLSATQVLKSENGNLNNEALSLQVLERSGLPIPTIIRHESTGKGLGSPFLLTSHLPGTSLAKILPRLSRIDRRAIERQLSSLEMAIAQYLSPTFGPVALVSTGRGFKSWREAFKSMLGGILEDGEDKSVNLPYAQIREQVCKAERVLDEVEEARLVVLGVGDADNVLVDERTNEVVGLVDFKKAVFGDRTMGTGGSATSCRGLM